jgi:di/tricarboxylate transporter
VGGLAGALAVPLIAILIICYFAGLISAFASSTALLGVVVPMAAPVIASGNLSPVAVVAAIAISTTIVDTSPFSTNGALVVANAEPEEQPRVLQLMLRYTALIVAVGPLFVWACIVLPWAG